MISKDRLTLGNVQVLHKNKTMFTTTGSLTYDKFIEKIEDKFEYDIGYIPAGAQHRPDIISQVFYGSVAYWWLIMIVNNISDPFEGLNVGDQIKIPKI